MQLILLSAFPTNPQVLAQIPQSISFEVSPMFPDPTAKGEMANMIFGIMVDLLSFRLKTPDLPLCFSMCPSQNPPPSLLLDGME